MTMHFLEVLPEVNRVIRIINPLKIMFNINSLLQQRNYILKKDSKEIMVTHQLDSM